MHTGKTVFAQLMDFIPMYEFRKCVERYRGNYKVKSFSCWDQYLSMAFAQLTYRESLRDIEACLRAAQPKLYHLGIRSKVSRNTLANANQVRDWRIYADFARVLIKKAQKLYADDAFGAELDQTVYALDSTMISLCLSLFPWARFNYYSGAIKLHTLLDLRGSIPTVVVITDGKVHDVNILDRIVIEPGAFYVVDRGYLDFERLYRIHASGAFFVIRSKNHIRCRRLYSQKTDKAAGIRCDQIVALENLSLRDYPSRLRRVSYYDEENKKYLVFLTNDLVLPARTIADIYRCRWHIELFFKWIKQHLRIKAFYGTSVNAVKAQVWIAISVYVLVAIVKKVLKLDLSLYTILQVLSVTLFEKTPILQVFSEGQHAHTEEGTAKQLQLFD
jgi:hypothetical protein